jgi:hypothetical protein
MRTPLLVNVSAAEPREAEAGHGTARLVTPAMAPRVLTDEFLLDDESDDEFDDDLDEDDEDRDDDEDDEDEDEEVETWQVAEIVACPKVQPLVDFRA